jgi:uncharacterized protein (UPF0147 family)
MSDEIQSIIEALEELATDATVPQSVRAKLSKSLQTLKNPAQDVSLRVNKVQDDLDQMTGDSNLPNYVRTQLMNISGMLEFIQF